MSIHTHPAEADSEFWESFLDGATTGDFTAFDAIMQGRYLALYPTLTADEYRAVKANNDAGKGARSLSDCVKWYVRSKAALADRKNVRRVVKTASSHYPDKPDMALYVINRNYLELHPLLRITSLENPFPSLPCLTTTAS